MKSVFSVVIFLGVAFSFGLTQMAPSHAPTIATPTIAGANPPGSTMSMQVTDRPVARINGAILTDRDLLREMLAMFPYARQHNGFPKAKEAQIRQGALQMIEFEELVYQEAERRKMAIPAERLNAAEASMRKQFSSRSDFDLFVKTEGGGSRQLLRQKIGRSLLIEKMLKLEVSGKAKLSATQLRDYYDKNPQRFTFGENFTLQTISILGAADTSAKAQGETRKRAEDALRQAKATKDFGEFGLLAEKISEDDYRVNMGLHKPMELSQLPPEIGQAVQGMAPGQVSGLIHIQNSYTLFRLAARKPAGKVKFEEVKDRLRKDLEKARYEQFRASLGAKLRQSAKIEEL